MDFGQFRIHRDRDEAAVACAVTGQKILPVGRASKDALAQTVGRMGLVWDFIGLLLLAEKALDFRDAFGIGGGDHLRHFDDPVALQLSVHVVVVQPPQVVREPFLLDRQQPKKAGLSCALSAHQTEHGLKLTSRLEHALNGSQQENLHGFASVLVLRSTEKMVQDVGYPFRAVPLQAVQVIPDGMITVLVGNDADSRFDFLFAGNTVFLHSPQDILHVGVVQGLAGAGPAYGLHNVDALTQQVQPDGIGKHMVVLQNHDTVLDCPLNFAIGVLGQHFFHIGNGSGSTFFVDFFAQ